jgi:hypothetical protein
VQHWIRRVNGLICFGRGIQREGIVTNNFVRLLVVTIALSSVAIHAQSHVAQDSGPSEDCSTDAHLIYYDIAHSTSEAVRDDRYLQHVAYKNLSACEAYYKAQQAQRAHDSEQAVMSPMQVMTAALQETQKDVGNFPNLQYCMEAVQPDRVHKTACLIKYDPDFFEGAYAAALTAAQDATGIHLPKSKDKQ